MREILQPLKSIGAMGPNLRWLDGGWQDTFCTKVLHLSLLIRMCAENRDSSFSDVLPIASMWLYGLDWLAALAKAVGEMTDLLKGSVYRAERLWCQTSGCRVPSLGLYLERLDFLLYGVETINLSLTGAPEIEEFGTYKYSGGGSHRLCCVIKRGRQVEALRRS